MLYTFLTVWVLNHDVTKIPVEQPIIFNLSLFFVFTFLILISLRKTLDDKPLSILQTNQMKGLSMLIIIIHHLSVHALEKPSDLLIFRNTGFIGVTLFLIISGFGLSTSMQTKGIKNFFNKRFTKVYIPFLFAMLLEVSLNYFLSTRNFNLYTTLFNIFLNVQKIDRNMWFIVFIFLWYGITYISFRLNLSNKLKIIFLFSVSLGMLLVPQIPEYWKINAFSFPFGCWLGLNYKFITPKLTNLINKKNKLFFGIIIGCFALSIITLGMAFVAYKYGQLASGLLFSITTIILYVCLRNKKATRETYIEYLYGLFTIAFVSLNYLNVSSDYDLAGNIFRNISGFSGAVFIASILSLMLKFNLYSAFLNWIGDISFELYLLHGMFMYSFDFILFRGNINVTFFIYLIAICLMSIFFQNINSIFYKSILTKSESR
jgi:membrane-bound acyltransferase YfiQ involved in biofilm formation